MKYIIDIESSDLLQRGLDYSKLPFKLKAEYRLWCVVIRNVDTNSVKSLVLNECTKENLKEALKDCTELIGHNIVGFDLPVLSLLGLLDYTIAYPKKLCTVFGKPVCITDTLIWSKLLDPDRKGGHSLDEWGKRLGNFKKHFSDFSKFTQEMLDYCIQDTNTNSTLYKQLLKEKGSHSWDLAYEMERKLVDLTLKQELFGFDFNLTLANKNIEELDQLMKERADRVNPILPLKKLNQLSVKFFQPPKNQFKQNGELSSLMLKFMEKHNCSIDLEKRELIYKDKVYSLPLTEPLETHEKSSIEDIDVVKGYLLSLGWIPSEVKERDLVKNTDKSIKTQEEILQTIDRYVKQTENSLFKDLRCEILGVDFENLKAHLVNKIDGSKPIYVPTTPKIQVGLEKEICPNLLTLGDKATFVKDVGEYFTYRHRRNSIAGGTLDDDGEPLTGFLSAVREDGRVPTPADTLGANTARYRHKIVCNIPRVTSLYGEKMRSLFGCGKGLYQLGFDFASLEARVQGHYCLPYKEGKELAEALVAEKPNDIHSVNARKLGIDRNSAKSFSYASMYGAQPKKLAKMLGIPLKEAEALFNAYWEAVPALRDLKDNLEKHWIKNSKTWVLGLDGRKIMTRSKHSLINVLFQSGGALVAKWSLVFIAELLEEKKLLGNPFTDCISDLKVWMMIAMHDEAQYAVHPKLLEVKTFSDEDKAKEFQKTTELTSAVGHSKKGFYVGEPTEVVFCIHEGIELACKELKTRVQMGFEWIPGLNWGQCH